MKKKLFTAILTLLVYLATIILMPLAMVIGNTRTAKAAENEINMTEGEVTEAFLPAGTETLSSDPSVAWVDENGNLNALKTGSALITDQDSGTEYTVTVADYSDGSETVGQLKILARFNDSMQFYDGHVYLLFTSYVDGVEFNVDDLYGAYEISGLYYDDIRKDISKGSNHTGTSTKKYFTFTDKLTKMTLNRGEIVTIGMYRGFDLSIPQAALGLLKNSSLWTNLSKAGKTAFIETLFKYLEKGSISQEELIEKLTPILSQISPNYLELLDGTVEGGLCFNRELYNQKLAWDQYENVTYEVDITRNQLDRLIDSLGGNLNKFSLMNNSCASVAVRGWNAALGEDSAYALDPSGKGIFAIMDAPKGVKESIMNRLPGYYLNNAEMVEEPNAGYEDETGWVYVSAPEKVDVQQEVTVYLNTQVSGDTFSRTKVYIKDAGNNKFLTEKEELIPGTTVYVSAKAEDEDDDTVLNDITLNGDSIMTDTYYDAQEGAYFFTMPDSTSWLQVFYDEAEVVLNEGGFIQIPTGTVLDISDYAGLAAGDTTDSTGVRWNIYEQDEEGMLEYTGTDRKEIRAVKEGIAVVFAESADNSEIYEIMTIEVYDSSKEMVKVYFDSENDTDTLLTYIEDGSEYPITHSGYALEKGTEIIVNCMQNDAKVLSNLTCNGKKMLPGEAFAVNEDVTIKADYRAAEMTLSPATVRLEKKGDTCKLNAKTVYTNPLYKAQAVYDKSIIYESSNPLVEVDENGLVTVVGDVPEDGALAIINVYAGSSNFKVGTSCRVIVGDYSGAKVVGKLTVYSRPSVKGDIPHSAVAFSTYEDTEISVSYYNYFKPLDKYNELLMDYDRNPENYDRDTALYDSARPDRESYFEKIHHGASSEPDTIKLKKGETISISNYSYEDSNFMTVLKALENSTASLTPGTQALIEQMKSYLAGEEYDGGQAFDGFAQTVALMIGMSRAIGYNPVDGINEGGMDINREIYNQFRRNDSQTPNNYYSIELTADEFEAFKACLANPGVNHYSLFNRSCATAARDLWNAATSDRPELRLNGNTSGLMVDSESLYFEIGRLGKKVYEGDEAGKNFYPRSTFEIEDEIEYFITEGADGSYTKGSGIDVVITAISDAEEDRSFEDFRSLVIDETVLTKDTDYTVAKGSTVVTIKSAALEKLDVGEHEISINFEYGSAKTGITVKNAENTEPDNDKPGNDTPNNDTPEGSQGNEGSQNDNGNTGNNGSDNNTGKDSKASGGNASGNGKNGDAPKTGDVSLMALWMLIFFAGAGMYISAKKQEDKQ